MPKKDKSKALMRKYRLILDKFGLQQQFDFTKKEKKVVKLLQKRGEMDILAICEELDLKPKKAEKVAESLLSKGAIERNGDMLSLTLAVTNYLHAEKKLHKSAKKFYQFVGALDEKEVDEFMVLVDSFKVVPEHVEEAEVPPVEEPLPTPKKPRGRRKAAPKVEEASAEEKKEEKPARAPRKPATRKRAPRKAKVVETKVEPLPEEKPVEEPKPEEKPNGEEI